MNNIFIIGNQGYLGSRLTDYLQERGYNCVGADIGFFKNGLLYQPAPVPNIKKEARTVDENDIESFDVVILLAGISNDPFGNLEPESIYDPTRAYAKRIALLCKKLGVRFIFPSSCSVYGVGDKPLDENCQVAPQTPYSLNKLQIEQDLAELSGPGFSPIALRLATVFGASPRIRFDLVINMLCGMAITEKKVVLNSNGLAWRPHLYIDDACEAFRCCIEWDLNDGKLMILNVGRNDNNWRILDVAKFVQESVSGCKLRFLGKDSEPIDDLVKDRKIQDGIDKRNYQVSFDKIMKILPGYEATWNVEKGIEQLLFDLSTHNLNISLFKKREFYRLQQIEYLYQTDQISDELFWKIRKL